MPEERKPERRMAVSFAIPTGAILDHESWTCGREYFGNKSSITCGCPECLQARGCTLIFLAEDMEAFPDRPDVWRIRVVAQELADYVPQHICPGYRRSTD